MRVERVFVLVMTGDVALWEQRPAWLVELIATSYELVSNASFKGYHILASEEYGFGDIAGSDLVATCMADYQAATAAVKKTPPFRLLDIGAGEGRFLEAMRRLWARERLQMVGVSAFVYDAALASIAAFESRILNVECLLASVAFQDDLQAGVLYDCILSAETFRHFQDPLGSLCQVFLLLRPGGVLAVDRLHVPGLGSGQRLLDWWREAGFEVFGEATGERIAPLLLRRASEAQVLRVPARYAQRRPGGADTMTVYAFDDAAAACSGDAPPKYPRSPESAALKLAPPWARIQRASKAPLPQWRQIESLMKQLVRK